MSGKSEAEKIDIIAKLSILMMFLPVPRIDEFVEKNIFIDSILQGDSYSVAIKKTMDIALKFEIKNHGINYNYKLEQMMELFYWVEDKLPDVPKWM